MPSLGTRYATEIASFVYADQDDYHYHTVLLIETPSDKATEFLQIQTARHRYMQSRVVRTQDRD